jgi:hypothetical protein
MGFKNRVSAKKLSMAQQACALRMRHPEAICEVRGNSLNWSGDIQPTPISPRYRVGIDYKKGKWPSTKVLSPKLVVPKGKSLPHVYDAEEQRLCLFYPRGDHPDWNSCKSLAMTIIPWASEWLFYYEIWLATGEWLGGGIHPRSTPKTEQKISKKKARKKK